MNRREDITIGTSHDSIETRRVPQVRLLNLGLGFDLSFPEVGDAGRIKAALRPRASAFHHLQLLPAPAAVEDRLRAGHLCARVGEVTRRDGVSSDRLCRDARACPSTFERTAAGDAFGGVAEVETARCAENADASFTCNASVVASAISSSTARMSLNSRSYVCDQS